MRGELSNSECCRHLHGITTTLFDIQSPVSDCSVLALQMLDGLKKKFKMQATIFESTMPLSTFAQAYSRLVLAEISIDKHAHGEGLQSTPTTTVPVLGRATGLPTAVVAVVTALGSNPGSATSFIWGCPSLCHTLYGYCPTLSGSSP